MGVSGVLNMQKYILSVFWSGNHERHITRQWSRQLALSLGRKFNVFVLLTFRSTSCRPGANVMQAAIVPMSNINAYMILVDVEFLHDGHALQHKEHAALPQQHAN